MKKTAFCLIGTLVVALAATPFLLSSRTAELEPVPLEFTLAEVIPDDVFLYVSASKNPERAFLDAYWGEVLTALEESGVAEDVIDLFSTLVGMENKAVTAQVDRLREKALRLVGAVDWAALGDGETVFVERFINPEELFSGQPPIMTPQMVWLFRGSEKGTAGNYEGLAAILDALAGEVNGAVGRDVLVVNRTSREGLKMACIDLTASVNGMPSMPLAVALRGNVLMISLRDRLIDDVLALMEGTSRKASLADSPRFRAAFAQLPPAEDVASFFDMQALMKPLRAFGDTLIATMTGPDDITRNWQITPEAAALQKKASAAYQRGDHAEAVTLIEEAHAVDGKCSIVLYNLACFNAMAGNDQAALSWLRKAVEGGFHRPKKIVRDSDLARFRGKPEFDAILARATELARLERAHDTVIVPSTDQEVLRLRMQIRQAYEEGDFERGLKLAEQAAAIAPDDPQVLYVQGCFHALLGHEETGLAFLERAVEGGFHCPRHIEKDPDWNALRTNPRYIAAQRRAAELAVEQELGKKGTWVSTVNRIVARIADAVGVLDYVAGVETTDGFDVRAESVAVLVPGASERPIYALFGNREPLTDFERFLPQETASFAMSGGFDAEALYTFIEDTIRLVGPPGEEVLAKWGEIQKQIGVDLQKDFFDWFDGDAINVTLAGGTGSVSLTRVTDEEAAREKVAAALDFAVKQIAELPRKNPAFASLAMLSIRSTPLEDDRLEGFNKLRFAFSPEPAVWGVADGHLIFGSSADAVALCLATARGEHPNIRQNEQAMAEALVPDGPFVAMSLTDMRSLGEEIEAGIGIAAMVTGMMGAFIPDDEARVLIGSLSGILGKLSPVVREIDFYKSKATCTTFDGKAWHTCAVTHYFSPEEHAARGL